MILTTNQSNLDDEFGISIKLTDDIFLVYKRFLEIWLYIIIKK